jgi:hypothetical protein
VYIYIYIGNKTIEDIALWSSSTTLFLREWDGNCTQRNLFYGLKFLGVNTFLMISFLVAQVNPQSSWIWKGLLKNRNVLEKGACWSVSMGDRIHVWNSPWIPLMPHFKPRPNVNLVDLPEFLVIDLLTG